MTYETQGRIIPFPPAHREHSGVFPRTELPLPRQIRHKPLLVGIPVAPDPDHKVLVWHWGKIGAGPKFTFEVAKALGAIAGFSPIVSCAKGSDMVQFLEQLPNLPSRAVRTFTGSKAGRMGRLGALAGLAGIPRIGSEFRELLRLEKPDILVCAFQSIWDLAVFPILRRSKKPFVLILHDATFHPGDTYPMRQTILDWEVGLADALIVLSDHVANAVHERLGFPKERIFVVPHGAFTFGDTEVHPRTFPRNRPLNLLFFGRIAAYKGLDLLLDAFRILKNEGADVTLDIVGSGDLAPYQSRLETLADVTVTNRWVGEDEIGAFLHRSDLVILPYIEASQSGVAASALAAGVPMIATPVGGLTEQVIHGRTGLVARGINAEEIAASIRSLIDAPSKYEALSRGALDFSRNTLGWDVIGRRIADILQKVMAMPRRRGAR
jgi:glycosyltransferase involved in cell wall biosynthesis